MKGTWVVFTAGYNHVFNPEPISEAWAMDCCDWSALGNTATRATQGVEPALPISSKVSREGVVPKRKPGRCDQKVAMWVRGRKDKD